MLRSMWNLATSDCLLKLVSIMLAGFIWFYVNSERSQEADIAIQVSLVPPPNTILIEPGSPIVNLQVKLKGPSDEIAKLPRPIEVVAQCELGRNSVEIDASMLKLPDEVKLSTQIQSIQTVVEERVTFSVPVIPVFSGSLPPGYIEGSHQFTPKMVSLTGPASLLKQIESLETLPIDLTGKNASFVAFVKAKLAVGNPFVEIEDTTIQVNVEIAELHVQKTFLVPVRVIVPPGFPFLVSVIAPETVSITVRGPEGLLEKLEPSQISVIVDVANITVKGIHKELPARVVLPEGLHVLGDPPRVEVHTN
ncbi:MAG: hypothetical protein Kow00107_06130 [Planctomycetota bacterium]